MDQQKPSFILLNDGKKKQGSYTMELEDFNSTTRFSTAYLTIVTFGGDSKKQAEAAMMEALVKLQNDLERLAFNFRQQYGPFSFEAAELNEDDFDLT